MSVSQGASHGLTIVKRKGAQPDPIQCNDQLQALQGALAALGPEAFCAAMFWILTKLPGQVTGRIVPFVWNEIQRILYKRLHRNNRVLKGRQAGLTTFFMLVRLFLPMITGPGKTSLLISQNSAYAQKHFLMARRAYKYIAAVDPYNREQNTLSESLKRNMLHTAYSNRRELVFTFLDSSFVVESAEVEEAGQGITVHHRLASEVARWPGSPEETLSNVKGAIVTDGTLDEESTANGAAGYFYEQCNIAMNDEAAADARFHYFSWFLSKEYSLDMDIMEMKEMLADLTADEKRLIAQMHKELMKVA